MSQKLCWKCRTFYERHCHHDEPEEKPKCWWCEDWLVFTKESKGFPIYEVVRKLIGLNPEDPKCPICDARLKKVEDASI